MSRALGDYVDAATDAAKAAKAAKAAEQVTTLAFKTMEDALVGFVTTGRSPPSPTASWPTSAGSRCARRSSARSPAGWRVVAVRLVAVSA
jgi:hypothetical protein